MTTVLRVDSSINGDTSVSRALARAVVRRLAETEGDLSLVERDLAADPLPPFTAGTLAGVTVEPQPQPAEHQAEERVEQLVLAELLAAEVIVIGAPMYNFAISAQLKTWIDYITVAGQTFRYSEDGPVGLLGGKRVIVVSTRGDFYTPGSPRTARDHHEPYLRTMFCFLGVTDFTIIRAEGLRAVPAKAPAIVENALRDIAALR